MYDTAKLKLLRKKYNYSIYYMSNKLNITASYYSQLENKRRNLSYNMATMIAKIFKLKPDDIFYNEKH